MLKVLASGALNELNFFHLTYLRSVYSSHASDAAG